MENKEVEEKSEKPSLFGMIMNPGIQFERMRENPKVLVAILIVTLLSLIGSLMMASGMDSMISEVPEFEGFTEEQLLVASAITQITAVAAGLLTPIVLILISTVIFIAIGKIVKSEVTFKQLLSMNAHIYLISALSLLLNGFLMMVLQGGNPDVYYTSLNSVIGAGGALGAFLNSIEVFSIWNLILTAIGLHIVAGFSKRLSWSIVIAIYIITLVFGMVAAALATVGV